MEIDEKNKVEIKRPVCPVCEQQMEVDYIVDDFGEFYYWRCGCNTDNNGINLIEYL